MTAERFYIIVGIDPADDIDPEAAREHIETVLRDVADGFIGDPMNVLQGATIIAELPGT